MLLKSVQRFAIYLLNPGGHVTTWNPAAQTIKGYSLHEVLERYFSIFCAPEDRAAGEPNENLSLQHQVYIQRRNGASVRTANSFGPT
jgi:PAS domain S-box-containing protein